MKSICLITVCTLLVPANLPGLVFAHNCLAPSTQMGDFSGEIWKIAPLQNHIQERRFVRFKMVKDQIDQKDMGESFITAGDDREKLLKAVVVKLRQIQYVLRQRYPQALKTPLDIVLVRPNARSPQALYSHLLAVKKDGRSWKKHATQFYSFKNASSGRAVREVYWTLDLLNDPRSTVDALARELAISAGLPVEASANDLADVFRDDLDHVRVADARERGLRYEEIAGSESFVGAYTSLGRGRQHDLWKSEETAIVLVRRRIQEKRPKLWRAYERVRAKIASGEVRPGDFLEEFLEVQQMFYGITLEEFTGNKDADLRLNAFRQCAFFKSYTDAIAKSFPELELNPIIFEDDRAWANKEDAIKAVHYRFATHNQETKAIWKNYVHIREKMRAGTIPAELYPQEVLAVHDAIAKIIFLDRSQRAKSRRKDRSEPIQFTELKLSCLVEHPEPFGGSYVRALVESFPGIGLNPISFPGMRDKWLLRQDAPTQVQVMFAGYFPGLWKETLVLRDRIRSGAIDPQDYPAEMTQVMTSYYVRDRGEYEKRQYLGLIHALTDSPDWKGLRSKMMEDILPEFPWTPAGFSEDDCWTDDAMTASEVRFRIARDKESQELFKEIRAMEKKIEKREVDPEDLEPEYVSLCDRVLKKFTSTWLYQHVSRDMFSYSPTPGVRRTLAQMLGIAFPLLKLNPLAMIGQQDWSDRDLAIREIRFRVARKWPDVWKAYRGLAKQYHGQRIKPQDYSPGVIYVTEFLRHLRREILISGAHGLGADNALRSPATDVFGGDPLQLLHACFPEIPLFAEEYYKRKPKVQSASGKGEEKELVAYRKARSSASHRKAVLQALGEFNVYLRSLEIPEVKGKLRATVRQEKRTLREEIVAAIGVTRTDAEFLKAFLHHVSESEGRRGFNSAVSFVEHAGKFAMLRDRDFSRLICAIWQMDPSVMRRLLVDILGLEVYRRFDFVRVINNVPFSENLPGLFPAENAVGEKWEKLLARHRAMLGSTGPLDTILVNAGDAAGEGDFRKALNLVREAYRKMAKTEPDEQEFLTNLGIAVEILQAVHDAFPEEWTAKDAAALSVFQQFQGRKDHGGLYQRLSEKLPSVASAVAGTSVLPHPIRQCLEASRVRFEMVAAEGILSHIDQRMNDIPPLESYDYGVDGPPWGAFFIHANLINTGVSKKSRRLFVNAAVYDEDRGLLHVVMERKMDAVSGLLDKPQTALETVLTQRALWSALFILDPQKLSSDDKEILVRMISLSDKELGRLGMILQGPITMPAVKAVLVPKVLAPMAKEVFHGMRIIEVPDQGATHLRVARPKPGQPYTGERPEFFYRTVRISVPAYEGAINAFLDTQPKGAWVLIHSMRLITPSDLATATGLRRLQPRDYGEKDRLLIQTSS